MQLHEIRVNVQLLWFKAYLHKLTRQQQMQQAPKRNRLPVYNTKNLVISLLLQQALSDTLYVM